MFIPRMALIKARHPLLVYCKLQLPPIQLFHAHNMATPMRSLPGLSVASLNRQPAVLSILLTVHLTRCSWQSTVPAARSVTARFYKFNMVLQSNWNHFLHIIILFSIPTLDWCRYFQGLVFGSRHCSCLQNVINQ